MPKVLTNLFASLAPRPEGKSPTWQYWNAHFVQLAWMGVRKVIVREMQRLTSLATTTPSESMRNMARKLSKDKNRNDIARNLAQKLRRKEKVCRS